MAYSTLVINSDAMFTSGLKVQGHQRLNVGITIGSNVSSLPAISAYSGIVTLQRRFGDDVDGLWRDVQDWAILAADGLDGGQENITTQPEPETLEYRIGVKSGEGDNSAPSGLLYLRLGTS
jgi:hypothetical protein